MERLIEDLLALAREGAVVTEPEPLALDEVAVDSWTAVPTEGAELQVDTDIVVHADPDRLRQLLENLFRNAVEHGSTGPDPSSVPRAEGNSAGDVAVTVDALEDGFVVEDDGPGIPPDEREQVFESGYSTAEGGTGLGLAIVDRIAKAHGWDVTVTGVDGTSPEEGDDDSVGDGENAREATEGEAAAGTGEKTEPGRGARFEIRGVETEV